ncbi:MAG: endonuclease IV, partial [Clostridia bacterium]|nr:endonuclease IV [Clostridia bacterium]
YVLDSAKALILFGGNRVVFHPAAQGKATREEAVALTEKRLGVLRDRIYDSGFENIKFCPETMGKLAQIGTVKEIVGFCKTDKIYYPCVDFGHVNAREGGILRTKNDFGDILDYMLDELGFDKVDNMHVHFSKIMYSVKGEIKHLTFADDVYGPECEPFIDALRERSLNPYIVCESAGTQAEDAKFMKDYYYKNV